MYFQSWQNDLFVAGGTDEVYSLYMNRKKRAWGLALSAFLTILIWRLPYGGYLLYPLTILATWFHEMAHGICALLLGGSFQRLELFADGSGLAVYSGALYLGLPGQAMVAAAGPLGPAVAGSLLILSSREERSARWGLLVMAVFMIFSVLVWVRTSLGVILIMTTAGLLLWMVAKGRGSLHVWTAQFLGVNACISVFLQIDYLFTNHVLMNGRILYSDTGQIARILLLPYWFWAFLLAFLTLLLPFLSLRRALR